MKLAVIEHPAAQSKGVVIFNPGGPGESGVLILQILAGFVPPDVRNDFTLVSFDERGTGASDPLLCGPWPRPQEVLDSRDRGCFADVCPC